MLTNDISRQGRRRWNALPVYYLLEGGSALLFHLVLTIYTVYYAATVGLDPLQIVLIGTTFETTIFLFEIPTGVVADLYSRRLSVILGVLLTGVGLLTEGLFPAFGTILLAQIIGGIGATFMSGATQAWITGEIGATRASSAFLRAAQIRTVCGLAGILLSGVLASIGLNLPFIAAGGLLIALSVVLIVKMPETGFHRASDSERASWRTFFATLRAGFGLVRLRGVLLLILAIEFVFAFHSEGFDFLWQNHVLTGFALPSLGQVQPVVWFSIIGVGANLLSLILSEVVRRRADLNDHRSAARALMALYGLIAAGILVFALAGQFALAVVAYWLVAALRVVARPVADSWLNQHADPRYRATLFSMSGQVNAVGEIVGGMPVGAIGRVFSLRASLAASGLILALTLPLFALVLRKPVVEPVSEAVTGD